MRKGMGMGTGEVVEETNVAEGTTNSCPYLRSHPSIQNTKRNKKNKKIKLFKICKCLLNMMVFFIYLYACGIKV